MVEERAWKVRIWEQTVSIWDRKGIYTQVTHLEALGDVKVLLSGIIRSTVLAEEEGLDMGVEAVASVHCIA